MEYAGGNAVGGGGEKMYFCHQCSRTVCITTSPNADPICPTCNDGFLEEYEDPNPNPNPYSSVDPFSAFLDPFSALLASFLLPPSSTAVGRQNPRTPSNLSGPTRTSHAQDPLLFDPVIFLQNYMADLAAGGASIEFVEADHPLEPGFQLRANLGDYFIGPGLEQLIQQLAENDPNRYGTPPASKAAVTALPSITVDDGLLSSELAQCAVCKDDFERGTEVKQMPCKHVYHSECILPWLELHNSCPVCRYELPTDVPDYENQTREETGWGNLGSGSGTRAGGSEGSSQGQQTGEHRVRIISVPWPFGFEAFGSGGGGGSNPAGRYDDLD